MSDVEGYDTLRPEDLPEPDADWAAIREFALTFDRYRRVLARRPDGDVTKTRNRQGRAVSAELAGQETDPTGFTLDGL